MLLVPLAVGLIAGRPLPSVSVLLGAACLLLFLARTPLKDLLRRGQRSPALRNCALRWLAVYAGAATVAGGAVLAITGAAWLLWLAAAALAMLVLDAWLVRRRQERSMLGELAGIGAMALSGPAGYGLGRGLDERAWLLYALTVGYFYGSVFLVKMLVESLVAKDKEWSWEERFKAGNTTAIYHCFLVGAVYGLFVAGKLSPWCLLAVAPAVARAFFWMASLGRRTFRLQAVGISEVAFAAWFGIWGAVAFF